MSALHRHDEDFASAVRHAGLTPHPWPTPEPGTVATGSPGCHSAELHSGVGDGRGGAGGGFEPRLGFCGTEPDPFPPLDPRSVEAEPDPSDLPELSPPSTEEWLVFCATGVLDTDGVGDAATRRLALGLGEATPLDGLADTDAELDGEPSPRSGSPAPALPAAEHPTTPRPTTTTAATSTTDFRGRTRRIPGLSSFTCRIPLIRCSHSIAWTKSTASEPLPFSVSAGQMQAEDGLDEARDAGG